LQTLLVNVTAARPRRGEEGKVVHARAVADSGGQVTCVSERLVNKLAARTGGTRIKIMWGAHGQTRARETVVLNLHSRKCNFTLQITAHVVPEIVCKLRSIRYDPVKRFPSVAQE